MMDTHKRCIDAVEADQACFPLILDIRALAASTPRVHGAVPVSANELTSNPELFIDEVDTPVLIVCDIGIRSSVVTGLLRNAGYIGAFSLEGGMEMWSSAGLPIETPKFLTESEYRRYDRQLKLPDFGVEGQQALGSSRVAVVGAGGLGVPVLTYLAAAGVGHLTIIDFDDIEMSNLHRQPIYRTKDIGRGKAEAAASFVTELNPGISISSHSLRISSENATELLEGHDVIVTCTDSFETAHDINVVSVGLEIPNVFGSIYRTEGQLAVLGGRERPCYACIFPPRDNDSSLSCSIVGVLGPVTGVIGSMQAGEVIKLLTGIVGSTEGELILYDSLSQTSDTLAIAKNPSCTICGES